ncbi:hypothetical protein H0H81_012750 [Sphagnurus paluster]|uniref:Amine oxidase domain-containing protein n=1 Tax=Sphagnurus paluster TaxID=117069 RepID=A0A9P7FWK0_9AGAR|nr:hypothetical protein H0H81_012750 [Sphagnurus paluster]
MSRTTDASTAPGILDGPDTLHYNTACHKPNVMDVGAMRFPETFLMQRTIDLIGNRLGLSKKILKYIRSNDNAFLHYNGITVTQQYKKANEREVDIFGAGKAQNGHVPDSFIAAGSGSFWTDIIGDLRQLFVDHPFDFAFQKLLELDEYTVTTYMTTVKKIPYAVVKWYETMEARTGFFDNSLTETVLASLAFMDPRAGKKEVNWFCFDGGCQILHKAMTEKINNKPTLNYRATALSETDNGESVTVTFDLSGGPRLSSSRVQKKYSNVISTMSMACLQIVDLKKIYLSNGQRDAIRQLTYMPSIKIGIQFKTPWWEKLGVVGGQSCTDLPIRVIIYPSYGPDDSHTGHQDFRKSNCLIASYNGMQDSLRLGGLMKGRGTPEENILVMRDLAEVHNVEIDELWEQFEDYHAWDWYRDPFQLGAFCQFGPGQFKGTYPYMTQPASKQQRLFFAGDATSTLHGWVEGALESGWRSVLSLLRTHPEINPHPEEDIVKKFLDLWGPLQEWVPQDFAAHNSLARQPGHAETSIS